MRTASSIFLFTNSLRSILGTQIRNLDAHTRKPLRFILALALTGSALAFAYPLSILTQLNGRFYISDLFTPPGIFVVLFSLLLFACSCTLQILSSRVARSLFSTPPE